MSGMHMAIDTLKVMARHAETLFAAHMENQGTLYDTPENATAIKALRTHRLIWQLDSDADHYQMSQYVTQLLDHSLRHYRRHQADESVQSIWLRLTNHLLIQYQDAKRRSLQLEAKRLSQDLQECLHELIELMQQATLTFAYYVTGGFTYITDLELRLKENEYVLERARKLNDVLDSFKLDELQQIAGADPLLRRLLLKYLPDTLTFCRRELVDSLHKLNDLLLRLRSNVQQHRLIAAFEARYERQPGWEPSIEGIMRLPTALLKAEPWILVAYPNTDDSQHEPWLSTLASGIRHSSPQPTDEHVLIDVEDNCFSESIQPETSPLQVAADIVFQEVIQHDLTLNASDAYQLLELDCPIDDWLLTLINALGSCTGGIEQAIQAEYIEDPDPRFPDQFWTRDIRISQRQTL